MECINLSTQREVCWDEYLMDKADGITVTEHHPQYRGIAMQCNMPWEGNICGYFHVIRDNRKVRLYYRGADHAISIDGESITDYRDKKISLGRICYAESLDGKTFVRPKLGLANVQGTFDNNVIVDEPLDNLCIFKDENPDCPPEELFKGLAGIDQQLVYYKSADGVHFEKVGAILSDGAYDSLNLAFWDKTRKKYFVYYRGIHRKGQTESDGKWHDDDTGEGGEIVRDVRVRTSPDFHTWDTPHQIEFDPEQDDYQLYTNQVKPYYRAPQIFLGMPTRYVERLQDKINFRYLPDLKSRANLTRLEGRSGYAMTDCILMTTRDGLHFRRTDEAFMNPGEENGQNWYYGNCYPAWGMIETESDRPGFPNEISLYFPAGYRTAAVTLERYAIRIDGFYSWHCDYKPGSVLTKPFTFEGTELEINFSTSALGYVRIHLCDEYGKELEGFDSGRLFGDSIDRPVLFDGDIRTLLGKPVRMKIDMSDAELYSFRFHSFCAIL